MFETAEIFDAYNDPQLWVALHTLSRCYRDGGDAAFPQKLAGKLGISGEEAEGFLAQAGGETE